MTSPLDPDAAFSGDEPPHHDAPPPTLAQWQALAERSLKGRSVDHLVVETAGGIPVKPLYTAEDRGTKVDLAVGRAEMTDGPEACVRIDGANAAEARSRIAEALQLGAGSLWFSLANDADGSQPSPSAALAALARAWATAPVHLDAGVATVADAEPLIASLQESSGSLGCDPLAAAAAHGAVAKEIHAGLGALPELVTWAGEAAPGFTPLSVSTMAHHGAGASEVDELAISVATGVEYLRALDGAGIDITARPAPLRVVTAIDRDVFTETAKLRALRLLWARVMSGCGAPPEHRAVTVHAVSSPRSLTTRDRWVNLLRITTEAASAMIGGADTLTTLPFDAAIGPPDRLSRRLAINTQTILREEAHVGRVQDPASGSYYVESLTDQLCDRAWQEFQAIEVAGGMAAFLLSGAMHRLISKSCTSRRRAVATRSAPITGVTSFPNLAEDPADLPAAASTAPAAATARAVTVPPLPVVRDSRPFEDLRDASDRWLHDHGMRPRVFLASMGSPPDHRTRAAFAKAFFEVGGIEVVAPEAFEDVQSATAAFTAGGFQLAVLCAADAWYETGVKPLAEALAEGGAGGLLLVGEPKDNEERWRKAGVSDFIHPGCDALDMLTRSLEGLGVLHV